MKDSEYILAMIITTTAGDEVKEHNRRLKKIAKKLERLERKIKR